MGFYSDFVRLFAGIGKIFASISKIFGILVWPLRMIYRAYKWYLGKVNKYKFNGEFIRYGLALLIPSVLIMEIIIFKPVFWFVMFKKITVWSVLPQIILLILLLISGIAALIGVVITIFGIVRNISIGFKSFKPKNHSFWHDVNKYMHGQKVNFH